MSYYCFISHFLTLSHAKKCFRTKLCSVVRQYFIIYLTNPLFWGILVDSKFSQNRYNSEHPCSFFLVQIQIDSPHLLFQKQNCRLEKIQNILKIFIFITKLFSKRVVSTYTSINNVQKYLFLNLWPYYVPFCFDFCCLLNQNAFQSYFIFLPLWVMAPNPRRVPSARREPAASGCGMYHPWQ